ncbi:MAG: signal peptidase I [Oscillospiraceae bacterium]|jgi:signal peptidase|nr:signal peptidase I [Oscillospiraceae bacterium]
MVKMTNEVKRKSNVGSVIFYIVLLLAVAGTVAFRSLGGYSFYTVLTRSMQSEIPQGSLVISKNTDPALIEVGDDITYLREDNSSVTHRVIGIKEDYDNSGERGFQTKGIENELPDQGIVYATNVIGVVKVSVPYIGSGLYWVAQHIIVLLGVLGVSLILLVSLRTFFAESRKERDARSRT